MWHLRTAAKLLKLADTLSSALPSVALPPACWPLSGQQLAKQGCSTRDAACHDKANAVQAIVHPGGYQPSGCERKKAGRTALQAGKTARGVHDAREGSWQRAIDAHRCVAGKQDQALSDKEGRPAECPVSD